LAWYEQTYDPSPDKDADKNDDPILELVGLGKAVWQGLGGGEAILKWLRSDDPDARPPWERVEPSRSETSWAPSATSSFWENVRELRRRNRLPQKWRASDLRPHLEDIYRLSTIRTMPANWSISLDGAEAGENVKHGQRPQVFRLGGGLYELIDDPERRVA
jgi:hypothetical protein